MKKLIVLLAVLVLAVSTVRATVVTIDPTDAKGIRFTEGQYFVVDYLSIRANYVDIDRSLLEFDVSGLSETIPLITLDLSFGNEDYPDPPDGIIDIFVYAGDGIVTAADFYAGGPAPFASFVGENGPEYGYVSIDVTSAVQAILTLGEQYLGFRLSTETEDMFFIGRRIGVPDPVLTGVPEPSTFVLLGLVGVFPPHVDGRFRRVHGPVRRLEDDRVRVLVARVPGEGEVNRLEPEP